MAVTFLQQGNRKTAIWSAATKIPDHRSLSSQGLTMVPGLGGGRGVAVYAKRCAPRGVASEDQRKCLETLRDLGPRDNAQTAVVRRTTARPCHLRGRVDR